MSSRRSFVVLGLCTATVGAFTTLTAANDAAARTAPAPSGACVLLQTREVQRLVRVRVRAGVATTQTAEGTGPVQVCTWEPTKRVDRSGHLVTFAVIVETGPGVTAAYDAVKAHDRRNIPISALGDGAFLETNDNLRIRVGERVLTVQIARYDQENLPFKSVRGLLTSAARLALPRLALVP